jgi:hypothetical protein
MANNTVLFIEERQSIYSVEVEHVTPIGGCGSILR